MSNVKEIPSVESLTRFGIRNISPYVAGDTAEAVRKKYQVTELLKLASNENQLGTSPKAVAAMKADAENTYIYPDTYCEELRVKLAERFKLTPHNILITSGGSGGISLVAETFLNPDDEVVYCTPTFMLYKGSVVKSLAKEVTSPVAADGAYDLDAMKAAITDRTKLVYICNPNNPTGGALKHDDVLKFVDSLPPHVIAVIDEAYIEFCDEPGYFSMVDSVNEERRLIIMRTFSKAYGLAAARIGYIVTSREIHANLMRAVMPFTGNRLGLAGAQAALDDDEFLKKSVAFVTEGRRFLKDEFEKLGFFVFASYANFLYVDTRVDTGDFAEKCKRRGLVIRGNFQFNRITVGTREQNEKMVEIIKEVLKEGVAPRTEKA